MNNPEAPHARRSNPFVVLLICALFAGLSLLGALGLIVVKASPTWRASYEAKRGQLALMEGDLGQAERQFRRALTLDPKQVEARRGLAEVLRHSNRNREALSAYEELVKVNPQDVRARVGYSAMLDMAGRHTEAEFQLRAALRIEPEADHEGSMAPVIQNNLAYLLAEQNRNLDEALKLAQKAVQARPEAGYIWDTLGWVYYRMKDYREAEYSLQRAVQLAGEGEDAARYHLGMVYLRMKKNAEAKTQFSSVPPQSEFFKQAEAALKALAAGQPVPEKPPAKPAEPKP